MQSISVFFDITKFADFRWKNVDVSRSQGGVSRDYCAKFHHCRICVTDFRDGGHFCSPSPSPSSIREQSRKCPSWIGLIKSWKSSSPRAILVRLQVISLQLHKKSYSVVNISLGVSWSFSQQLYLRLPLYLCFWF